ncbi:MAG: TlyA family RNA methyltransferase [Deltaproteobacteria bacterium]|nr:TlyA family RNA methyltransferase [Candidatus Anaeroferrophillus wilburensis]MBN2889904.1 TlyA family RNA methyltransferase [Deltaproteobacteria bacterium]
MSGHRERLDMLLVSRGLAASRERARSLILAGKVICNNQTVDKAGHKVPGDAQIRLKGNDIPYVGRGGVKLAAALETFTIDPTGCVALDVGASTGGFTHCLLLHGARQVVAVDVGYGQLAWELQQDPRVVVKDRTNIRSLVPGDFPQLFTFTVVDVSFISLTKVLPVVANLVAPGSPLVALVKPQFEVGRSDIGKGGIVRDEKKQLEAVENVIAVASDRGLRCDGRMDSPILGQKGNREFLILLRRQ